VSNVVYIQDYLRNKDMITDTQAHAEWERVGLRTLLQKLCNSLYETAHGFVVSFLPDSEIEAEKELVRVFGADWRTRKG